MKRFRLPTPSAMVCELLFDILQLVVGLLILALTLRALVIVWTILVDMVTA